MNKFITYCARAKFTRMISTVPECVAIKIISNPKGGFEIDFLFSKRAGLDIILCNAPLVLTNQHTLSLLEDASIDFSYSSGEFIITRKHDVVSSHS